MSTLHHLDNSRRILRMSDVSQTSTHLEPDQQGISRWTYVDIDDLSITIFAHLKPSIPSDEELRMELLLLLTYFL